MALTASLSYTPEQLMKRVPLPAAIIPFILENVDGFDAYLEDGERVVITPKDSAVMKRSAPVLNHRTAPPAPPKPILRPKFIYRILDRTRTPAMAKQYGFSEPRLRVYQAIWDSPKGIGSKELLEKTGLPHGSVQQILHWLRKQKLVSGEPEA